MLEDVIIFKPIEILGTNCPKLRNGFQDTKTTGRVGVQRNTYLQWEKGKERNC